MATRELGCMSRRAFLMLRLREYSMPSIRIGGATRVNFSLLSFARNHKRFVKPMVVHPSLCELLNASMSTKEGSRDFDLDIEAVDKSSKVVSSKVESLRVDLILKAGLGIPRNKVEKAFYQSRVRVNGKKIFKKGQMVHEGDEVDLIRGVSPMNPDFLTIARIEILDTKDEGEDYSVRLRRTKSLLVENYDEPWDGNE